MFQFFFVEQSPPLLEQKITIESILFTMNKQKEDTHVYICGRTFNIILYMYTHVLFFNSINHKKDNAQEKLDFKYCNFWRRFVSNKVVGSCVPNL